MAQALYSPSFFIKLAVIVSVGAHAIVLAVRFVPPALDQLMNHKDLEVVLVNSRSDSKPLKDYVLAQANLDGGGNTDQNRRLATPLPNLEDGQRTQQLEDMQKRQVHMERQSQQLLTDLSRRSQEKVYTGESLTPQTAEEALNVDGQDALQTLREMQMLQAEIRKQTDEYQKRPRRTFIGARTKSAPEAAYIEAFRTRVDRIGTQNFPPEAKRRKLYGAVLLDIQINHDGKLLSVTMRKSSGSKLLDEAALAIIRLSSPFPPFPPQLRKTTDELFISRHMTFTRENLLESTGTD